MRRLMDFGLRNSERLIRAQTIPALGISAQGTISATANVVHDAAHPRLQVRKLSGAMGEAFDGR